MTHERVIHKLSAYVYADMVEDDTDHATLNRMDAVELCERCAEECAELTDVICTFEVGPDETITCFICEGRR